MEEGKPALDHTDADARDLQHCKWKHERRAENKGRIESSLKTNESVLNPEAEKSGLL